MKADTEVGLVVIFTVLGFSFGRMVSADSVSPFFDYFFTPITTLAAAFGGSWYAFKLQDEKAQRDANDRDVKAANGAVFELARWYNKYLAFRKQFIEPEINDQYRHLKIMPAAGMSHELPRFDYDALAFLFKSGNPNLLGTLSLVEQEIASTLDVIQQRSKLHVEILQPAAERVKKRLGSAFPVSELEKELGSRHLQVLLTLTSYMIGGVDDSLSGIKEHIDLLKSETVKLYPGHVVIGMVLPSASGGATP